MIPRFYMIVDSVAWIERLIPAGVKLFQLRIKGASTPSLESDIARAIRCCREANALCVINDYWQLAIDLGADYVHLGQEDLDTADLAAIRAAGIKLGISTHSHEELDRALSCQPDYIALGPVYPTILKKMPWAPQGTARIAEWKQLAGDTPIVAIGGLTVERAPAVLAAGSDSLAVVTDVTLHPEPENRVAEWLRVTGSAS